MGRTVIVGDVHGCVAELGDLLERVQFGSEDRLYLVGDLVGRGPDAAGVLRLARELGGRAVLGNHEQSWLARRFGPNGAELSRHRPRTPDCLALGQDEWELLQSLPLVLDLPDHDVRIVHGGVLPGLDIGLHPPWVLTNLRSIDESGEPSSLSGRVSWAFGYSGGPHVVFGHDARRGLQVCRHATGLDTGCVYGGKLTALVLGPGQRPPAGAERASALVQVSARAAYCPLK